MVNDMATKKEVATAANNNPFGTDMPSYMQPESSRGSQEVGLEDVALPRISMIQDLSPQHKKSKPEYIEGAEPGMIFNTVTGELYSDSLYVVPAYYRKEWVIWKDQNKGGGFRGSFATEEEAVAELQNLDDAADCEVVDTAQHYVLVVKHREDFTFEAQEAVISMSKSQMKVNRKWNAEIRVNGGDRFSRVYQLSAVVDTNAAGQEYYNWRVKSVGFAPESVYKAAEAMYEAVRNGERDIAREVPSTAAEVEETDEM
jgi:hypothetical protein